LTLLSQSHQDYSTIDNGAARRVIVQVLLLVLGYITWMARQSTPTPGEEKGGGQSVDGRVKDHIQVTTERGLLDIPIGIWYHIGNHSHQTKGLDIGV